MEQDSLARSPAKLNQTNRLLVCVSLWSVQTYLSLLCLHSTLLYNWLLSSNNTSLFICAACSDFYLMSVRLSKTLHSLVKCWPWDVFPGALWCFKEHFYLAGKGLVTKHNCTWTPWIISLCFESIWVFKVFPLSGVCYIFFVDLFVCLFVLRAWVFTRNFLGHFFLFQFEDD